MATTTKNKLAAPMIFSVYPGERAEIMKLQQKLKLRTPFDVIRLAIRKMGTGTETNIHEPRQAKS